MALIGPVSVSMPSWLSKEMLVGAAGCAGGIIFGDFIASYVLSRTGWTGTAALAASSATKVGLGGLTWYGATKVTGMAKPLLGLASIGLFASAISDVVVRYWPAAKSASARLGAAVLGARATAAAPAGVTLRVAPGVAPGIAPSDIALGEL